MSEIHAKRVHVVVDRGPMEKIPTTIYAHEVPCLEIQHGEGSVHVPEQLPDGMDYAENGAVVTLDLDEEWARLIGKYGRHPDMNVSVCEYVFQGQKANLARACAESATRDETRGTAGVDADGDGNMAKAEIQAALAEMAIPFHKNATKAVLLETLRDGLSQILDEAGVDHDVDAPVEVLYRQARDLMTEGSD